MKTYKFSLKVILLMALVCMLFSNSVTYYSWLLETDHIAYNFSDPLDGESENETENTEKDIDDKLRSNAFKLKLYAYLPVSERFYFQNTLDIHILEIPTPPPKQRS